MSMFSGKCDCYDGMVAIGCEGSTEETLKKNVEKYLAKTDIYIGFNNYKLKIKADIKTYKDLVPCFPKLEIIRCSNNEKNVIVLSEYSFAEKENEKIWKTNLDILLRYYRKCKRKKIPFDKDEALKILCGMTYEVDEHIKLIDRVMEHGEKATVDGLSTIMVEHYRKYLYEECLDAGYDEADARSISNYKNQIKCN